ncbi:MAG: tetratricopeptide repeat protein [Bryobacteraceae bacterium]
MKYLALLPLVFTLAAQTQPPVEKNPSAFDVIAKKAEAARQDSNTVEAIALYSQAVRLKAAWSEGWWYLGTLYYDSDQYTDGLAAFRRLTLLEPKMTVAWAMLGLCEFETKNYDHALEHLQQAGVLGLAPDQSFFAVARYHEALLLTRSEQYDAAIDILSKMIAHGDTGPKQIEALGIACLFKPVLPSELPPTERELVMAVGRAMADAATRRTADAVAQLEALLRDHPNQPQLHYLYGLVLLAGDPDKALQAFQEELAISPNHEQSFISIAGEYLKRTDYASALPFAEKAAAAEPNLYFGHAMLGRVLVEGDLDVARGAKELEIAARLAPTNLQVRFTLASAYSKLGRKEDAARERAEFLRLRAQTDVASSASGQK